MDSDLYRFVEFDLNINLIISYFSYVEFYRRAGHVQ